MALRVPASAAGGEREQPMAQVNVTSLVDVFLVVLILFMVTAPLLDSAIEVELPEITTAAPAAGASVVVFLDAEGSIAVDEAVVTLDEAIVRCRQAVSSDADAAVFLRADRAVPYGFVMSVLDALRRAGIETATLVVQPLPEGEGAGE
jgi:biopolymer transport protein ExbD